MRVWSGCSRHPHPEREPFALGVILVEGTECRSFKKISKFVDSSPSSPYSQSRIGPFSGRHSEYSMSRNRSATIWSCSALLFLLNAGTSNASFISAAGESWRPSSSASMSVPESSGGEQAPADSEGEEVPADANANQGPLASWDAFKTGGSMGGNSHGSQEGGQNSFFGLLSGDDVVRLQRSGWLRFSRLAKFVPPLPMTLLRPPRLSAAVLG